MREDNRNSVCDIDDEVSPASSSGRIMSVAQTHNLRSTEHQIHMDIHEVSPASASGRIMSVAQTHNLRSTEHQIHMDIHEVSPASASGRIMSVAQTHNLRTTNIRYIWIFMKCPLLQPQGGL